MILNKILANIPDYKEFLTVNELNDSSRKLAKKFKNVELINIGVSGSGREILCLKIGKGKKNALLFAFPHPNEPIGSLTLEFISKYLATNPDLTNELDYTWYLIKVIDPDGAVLNEGWFKGKFDPLKYARNYYRPPSHEQIEWTFPIEYKKLIFSNPPPETRALIKLIDEIKPTFMFSLHNAGFCGVYWYVTHDIKNMYPDLMNLVKQENLPIHRGEPEAQYLKELHPAIFQMFGIKEGYDFYEENGVENPQELIKCGTSSDDYLLSKTNGKGFTLLCEMPYFYDNALDDDSQSNHNRREVILELFGFFIEIHEFAKRIFNSIKEYCNPSSRIFTSTIDYIDNFRKRIEPLIEYAKTSKKYNGKATVAQAFDNLVASRYYSSLRLGMLARLCEEVMIKYPELKVKFQSIKSEVDLRVEQIIDNVLKRSNFEIIPIQKLVKIQVGSALIAIQHLRNF
ncbi:MAG: zinc carboxypeptidase [Promethearchaeota archaeon]|nr:MAG: zinc carboxypeptidase [Candidatus Lokiarchaeota archaeon]